MTGVYTQGYFTFWVILSLIWTLVALVAAAVLPILEAGPIFGSMLRWTLSGFRSTQAKPAESKAASHPSETFEELKIPSELVLGTASIG